MKRSMQANEIRTNIIFEFAVVGDASVRAVSKDILNLVEEYKESGVLVRLVGINLKKPTANPVFLTKHVLEVETVTSDTTLAEPVAEDEVATEDVTSEQPLVEEKTETSEEEEELTND